MISKAQLDAVGLLVVRVVPAVLMLFHGVSKLRHGIDGVVDIMTAAHVPAFVAYGVYVGEVVAPLLMIAGWMSRPAGAVFAFNMVVAIVTAHWADVTKLGKVGQWSIELQLLFLFGGVAVALLGPGPWSVSRGKTRLG